MAFTADFARFTRYNPDANVLMVRFAAGAPALETEFNELQLIQDQRLRDLASLLGDGLLGDGTVEYKDSILTIQNERAIVGGYVIYISKLEIELIRNERAYIDVWVQEVTINDTLKLNGNLQEIDTQNTILDERFGKEVSRRKILVFTLSKHMEDGHSYLPIGRVERNSDGESVFIPEYPKIGDRLHISRKTDEPTVQVDDIYKIDLTIPTEGWIENAAIVQSDIGDTDYKFYIDIPMEGITEEHIPELSIYPISLKIANECKLCPSVRTLDGVVRLYSIESPTDNMQATLILMGVDGNPPDGADNVHGVMNIDLTIPTEGWKTNATILEEDTGGEFGVYLDLQILGVKDDHIPSLRVYPQFMDTANECRLCPSVRTLNTYIRLYAEKAPEAAINASLTLMGVYQYISSGTEITVKGGIDVDDLPVATTTQRGVVQIGQGIEVDNGTISVSSATISEAILSSSTQQQAELRSNYVATKEEGEAMLNDVLGDDD